MLQSGSKSGCEVAVVGAGPYGLAVAAHLKGANIDAHVFGDAMSFWRGNMPKGMKLRSPLTATDLADPNGTLSLKSYADERAMKLSYPFPLEDFIRYGEWFQSKAVADLDGRKVIRIEPTGEGFCLWLDDGDRMTARRVVLATGLDKHEHRPAAFAGLPADLVSHSCEHDDLTPYRGKRVAVIGRGQSACESAALLNQAGAAVELMCRGDVRWLGLASDDEDQPSNLKHRIREFLTPKSAVGPFPLDWLVEFPDLVRRMPQNLRASFNARCLKAAAAGWLKPGFEGVTVVPGRTILGAKATGSQVALQLDEGSAAFDHVFLATGYRVDIAKLGMLAPQLLERIERVGGSPVLSAGLESSVTGLHFVGASSVMSYGPLMRFVAGSGYAARHLTWAVQSRRASRRRADVKRAQRPIFAQRH